MGRVEKTKKWEEWFKSDEASEACNKLRPYRDFRLPSFGRRTTVEVSRLLCFCSKTSTSQFPPSESEVREKLRSMNIEQLRSYVDNERKTLQIKYSDMREKRERGWRRVTTSVQEFSLTFDQFLSAYSGVVELVAHADSMYGNVASATLSLLFASIKNKAAGEAAIQSAMQQITDRLPDLDIYQSVYADTVLGRLLADAYVNVICFSRTCIEFYESHGYIRVLRSIGKPREFESMEENMRDCFTKVRTRTDALLAERVAELKHENVDLLRRLEGSENRHDRENLLTIQRHLGPENLLAKVEQNRGLDVYQKLLNSKFSQDEEEVARMKLSQLQNSPEFTKWMEADSSMLVMYGSNALFDQTNVESWLSEPAVEFIRIGLTSETENPTNAGDDNKAAFSRELVYYLCTTKVTHKDVLSNIMSRLLEDNPAVLREGDDLHTIMSNVERFAGYPHSSPSATPAGLPVSASESPGTKSKAKLRQQFEASGGALLRIVERIANARNSTVYIIVDRPEVCDGGNTSLFLGVLLNLVSETRAAENSEAKVKVWVVMRAEFWSADNWREGLENVESLEGSTKLVLCRKDQRRLY